MAADPRDSGPAMEPPASTSSFSPALRHLHSSSSSTSSSPNRLPQGQFNFEYHIPLRKRALTASAQQHSSSSSSSSPAAAAAAAAHHPAPRRTISNSSTTAPVHVPQHRRSVPNFSLPHIAALSRKSSFQSPLSTLNQNSLHSPRPREVESPGDDALNPNASKRRRQSAVIFQDSAKNTMPTSTQTYVPYRPSFTADKSRALNGVDKQAQDPDETITSNTSREDIFLNIARSDPDRHNSLARSEFRRSRLGLSSGSLRSPTSRVHSNDNTPSPEQLRSSNSHAPLRSPLHATYGSVSYPHSSASAHPLEDHSRTRYAAVGSSSRSSIGLPRSRLSRASPDASPRTSSGADRRASWQDPPRIYPNPALSTIRSSRLPSSSETTERVRVEYPDKNRQDGTESTLSTNAPSTVWDELEDLKSRIRKLELTGKLPPSSQAAMSSASNSGGERPRTAATTATTLSSSPNHRRKESGPSAEPDTAPANPVHPLLQSALAKSKTVLGNDVYRTLEATATDATALSTILGSGSIPSSSASVINGYNPSDRQSRRKADSVCRGLTELCLALSDDYVKQHEPTAQEETVRVPQQNGHTHPEPSTPTLPLQRRETFEPEGIIRRRSSARVASRLESRRASMVNGNSPSYHQDDPPPLPDKPIPQQQPPQTPAAPPAQPQPQPEPQPEPQQTTTSTPKSRLNRLSTSFRTRRAQPEEENAENESSHNRTLSRAMTIATPATQPSRLAARQRLSQSFTSSQSIPNSPREPQTPQQQPPPPTHQRPTPTAQQQQQQEPQSVPRTPNLSQSAIPLRRSFISHTPTTSRSNIQSGSRRYGLSTFSSTTPIEADIPETPQQSTPAQAQAPTPSQTRIVAPSSKIAASYTPIQQNQSRSRANSLGTRRFGIRPRPMVNVDNVVNGYNNG
ncbi:putative LPXTG-motif cell wall anchor domain protein [Aspergillus glaucus CBS 516.65]|uniref:LPXTG-motif cell wall anchor domain protein n=1 Tax=Aspergillus glaucus CBS 516.65 TaxID=1160497 RepID=A0A1L9V6C6_ASPGL|nr:hypothetical protein ASPGLDRAFT_52709 [Aspergillus glaucus CBS 516.65]OJJ79441.1 hypothetical protein ASPGLDRAFT_52709 [Aspergillus glaucus CBS 516.65]